MNKSIADQLVSLGVVDAGHVQEVQEQHHNRKPQRKLMDMGAQCRPFWGFPGWVVTWEDGQ